MTEAQHLTRSDLSVLFWIVGCTRGASFEEIVEHEGHRRREPPSPDAIRESLSRLEERQLIFLREGRYWGNEDLQTAFLRECRNCRDTIEEVDVLRRLLGPDARREA